MRSRLHILCLLLLQCLPAWGQTVWTNYDGGSPRPLTLLLFPDGYTDEEGIGAIQHMQLVGDAWVADPLFDGYRDRLRVITLHIPSEASGASYRGRYTNDTRYGSTFNYYGTSERVLVAANGYQAFEDIADHLPTIDNYVVAIVANSTIYGGTGGYYVSISRHAAVAEITRHELGHRIAGAGDEYASAYAYPDIEEPNTTRETDRDKVKWKAWFLASTPVPTPAVSANKDLVGLFEGAHYHAKGWFRPCLDCKMRTLGKPWCPVCREAYLGALLARTSPAGHRRAGSVALSVEVGS